MLNTVKSSPRIRAYIKLADAPLSALGYTDHSFSHVELVAKRAGELLTSLGYSRHEVELAEVAGYLHDVGNLVNRVGHSQSGAIIAFRLLEEAGLPPEDIAAVVTAIGNHDEGEGEPVSPIAAALILADKSDVRRSRVRNRDAATFDIHDRVNFSVLSSSLERSEDGGRITLTLSVDTAISPVLDYFEIFLDRMLLCRRAAARLGCRFSLVINGQVLL